MQIIVIFPECGITQDFNRFTVFPSFRGINLSSSNFPLFCEELIEDTFIVVGGGFPPFLHIVLPDSTSPSQFTHIRIQLLLLTLGVYTVSCVLCLVCSFCYCCSNYLVISVCPSRNVDLIILYYFIRFSRKHQQKK